ncbi:aminofutalosine synthase MqnE [Geobacter sulfurreducens]|jgi:aminodeoxyfutalosine synthase|uniref:Aminodeoxyfutalosine synthase n=1 Tax=Geobacter sulfurreducens (strain ATCC 51573 / DSM 12127 / PCA) TaxID=243231 RepID=Q74G11_GEOSL|nr:aminofutalosine synthase MqnE [Geobacter sulfurreducens]AAR33773.1 dehypoxanthinylfutalosine cyclase, putative [Geobacter sulfurreducens PCA]UAC04521.1 aminofutalosine synthase MqnE [Geobacter sulfurreducens]HBB69669.1 aminofutalosine synthase MqnE [Geobacter sulfurreducens]HCD95990.1 aminofutalosine synthase MqnE [Geobacter sulfurreducens]
MSISLATISGRVHAGERISDEEALFLFESRDPLAVGELAAAVNRRRNGDRVFFNVNRHINHTNICVNRCSFCAFYRAADEPGAYLYDLEEIRNRAAEAHAQGATEIHIVGGLHPDLPFDFYLAMLRTVKEVSPDLHVKAFTAVEIEYLSRLAGLSTAETLTVLKEAGLGSLPGGGAEIFAPAVRNRLCPEKISGDKWLAIMEEVHRAGLKSNATMLYGHIESYADRVDHMRRLRELQDRTGGFQVFIPLAFQKDNNPLGHLKRPGPGGVDALLTLAVARIYLDNFANIKAYWVMLGVKIAQTSLAFGVNDLDGTVVEEKIGHDAGAASPQTMGRDEIVSLIRTAGRVPVERDTLYNELRVY